MRIDNRLLQGEADDLELIVYGQGDLVVLCLNNRQGHCVARLSLRAGVAPLVTLADCAGEKKREQRDDD